MQLFLRRVPDEIDEAVRQCITSDVTDALQSVRTIGDRFVINDKLWWGRSGERVRICA